MKEKEIRKRGKNLRPKDLFPFLIQRHKTQVCWCFFEERNKLGGVLFDEKILLVRSDCNSKNILRLIWAGIGCIPPVWDLVLQDQQSGTLEGNQAWITFLPYELGWKEKGRTRRNILNFYKKKVQRRIRGKKEMSIGSFLARKLWNIRPGFFFSRWLDWEASSRQVARKKCQSCTADKACWIEKWIRGKKDTTLPWSNAKFNGSWHGWQLAGRLDKRELGSSSRPEWLLSSRPFPLHWLAAAWQRQPCWLFKSMEVSK